VSRSKSATGRLEAAEAAIQEGNRRLAELSQRRNECLLRDRDSEAAALALEIQEAQRLVQGHTDKVALLRAEAEREANEKRIRENEAQNKRIDALFDLRDEDIAKLAALEEQRATLWRRVLDANRRIVAAHSWSAADLSACMLIPLAVGSALSFESYRQSYTPRKFGGQVEASGAGQSLPGSRVPRVEWREQPSLIRPMKDVFRDAGEHGKRRLRGQGSAAAPLEGVQHQPAADSARARVQAAAVTNGGDAPVTNGHGERPPHTTAQEWLVLLWQEQEKLAKDTSPQGDLAYKAHMEKVTQAQDAVDAEKRVAQQ
jgi:hypothetical protein